MQKKHLFTGTLIATSLFAMNILVVSAEETTGQTETPPTTSSDQLPPTPGKPPIPVRKVNIEGGKVATVTPRVMNKTIPPREMERGIGSTTKPSVGGVPMRMQMNEKELRAKLMLRASSTASTTRPILIPKEKREEWKNVWMKTPTTTKERIKEKVTGEIQGVVNRLRAVVTSLTNISNRVTSRIEKLNASGVDTTEAAVAVGLAKEALTNASTEIDAVVLAYKTMQASENPREEFTNVQNAVNKVKDSLKLAHKYLEEAIRALKGLSPQDTATTSSETQ